MFSKFWLEQAKHVLLCTEKQEYQSVRLLVSSIREKRYASRLVELQDVLSGQVGD